MDSNYDAVVFGGGTAGVCAAVQAARAGAKTLLVDKAGQLGGTMTSGGISNPASFWAWGRQVIAGTGWELVRKVVDAGGGALPDPGDRCPVHIHLNPALIATVADELVVESGCDLLLHAMPAEASFDGSAWRLAVCTKTGLRRLAARTVIDCTGDANVVTLGGLAVERPETLQPATLVVKVSGYDADRLDYDALQQSFERAVANVEVRSTDPGWGGGKVAFFLRRYGGNRIHVCGVNGTDSEGRTAAELAGRAALMRLYRWARKQKGLENIRIDWMAPETGIRETVVIAARTKVTEKDYRAGRVYDDAVCYSLYPIDIHLDQGIDGGRIREGVFPTIPLGAMLPRDGRGIIVAGRCVAGDRRANSSFRVEAPCMAMGQVAGAAAALAARAKTEVQDVSHAELCKLLESHGAIVPPALSG